MSSSNTINLIRTRTSSSPQLDAIEGSLRRTAYIGLIVFLSLGFLTGVVFFLLTLQKNSLEARRVQLTQQVAAAKRKEGILISIKERTQLVTRAMKSQKPWAQMLDRLSVAVSSARLSHISVDEQNKVTLTIQATSLDDVLGAVIGIIAMAKENYIRAAQLVSLQLGKTGGVEISVSFFAQF